MPNTDRHALLNRLRAFDFSGLFTQELGWDRFAPSPVPVVTNGQTFTLTGVAEKRGVQVFLCSPDATGAIPPAPVRNAIEKELVKIAREHLLIFADAAKSCQLWIYPRREPGRPIRQIPWRFEPGKSNEALLQKLDAIAFALNEEEALDLFGVVRRLKDSLDRDRVTKSFYTAFEQERKALQGFIEGIPVEEVQRHYVAVLLNRLIFIYFIQEKGFLGDSDKRYLQNRLATCSGNYYQDFLCPLFFAGFAVQERPPAVRQLLGNVPYLNGGLFLQHQIEKDHAGTITIPNTAFQRLFAFFDRYHWHLDDRPIADGNEINPDILGYIFEKFINQKQMGAYYTKEDITEYIGKNTILPFLFDAARKACKIAFDNPGGPTVWDLLRENPDRYIYAAVRHGTDLPLPPEIAQGVNPPTLHHPVGDGPVQTLELRRDWNKPAPAEFALPTEIWRETVARRQRYFDLRRRLGNPALTVEKNESAETFPEAAEQVCGDSSSASGLAESAGGNRPDLAPAHESPAHSASPVKSGSATLQRGSGRGENALSPTISDINDLITLNLDIRQFAQDVIEGCEGPELLRAFWHALEKVTILDPTCGSGAFLFAALNILEPLYEACLDRMQEFLDDEAARHSQPPKLTPHGVPLLPHKRFEDFSLLLDRVAAHANRRYFIFKSIILNH